MQFDRGKMREVLLRTFSTCEPADLGAVKLNKILYFTDMLSYAFYRVPVTGAIYRKRPNGPTTDQLLFTLREMQNSGELEVQAVNYFGYIKKEYRPLIETDTQYLNSDELSLLDEVIDFVCKRHTAKSISDFSHNLPWELAEMGGEIPYHTAMMLFPMEPSPEAFELAETGKAEIEAQRSQKDTMGVRRLRDFRKSLH
ncbi:MAG: Panacea domain-containing protein [Pseudomonadota bacterium]